MTLLQELREESSKDQLKYLTLDQIENLKGKRIQTIYFGYRGQNGVDDFTVGEVVSEWDLAAKSKMPNWPNRQAYWESYMSEDEISEFKSKLTLITSDGRNTMIHAYQYEGLFWCSDSDRYVEYRVVDEH